MITSSRSAPLAVLLQRVREQYRETPGLKLTKPQAMRLFGVAPSVCAAMFRALVMENFLSRTGEGVFMTARESNLKETHAGSSSVTSVGRSPYVYAPAANHDADGDSNGTTVSVTRR